jgi:hypothetical protein
VTKARTILGYAPQIDLRTGLEREWGWIQQLYPVTPKPEMQLSH